LCCDNHLIIISFVQTYLSIRKSNREIEIDATVVIANIVIETDMVGLRGMVVAVGLLRGDTTMTGMVLHHPDSTVVVHHLQALVVAFLGATSPHPIQECEGVGVHRDVMTALLV
jgi:hypothetical protein